MQTCGACAVLATFTYPAIRLNYGPPSFSSSRGILSKSDFFDKQINDQKDVKHEIIWLAPVISEKKVTSLFKMLFQKRTLRISVYVTSFVGI